MVGSTEEALRRLKLRGQLVPSNSYLGPETSVDTSVTNASSIVLLLEWGDTRVLLTGDSTPSVLVPAVRRLLRERRTDQLSLDVFKLPHHGSSNNLNAELVCSLPARDYLVSTDGGHYDHPGSAALDLIASHSGTESHLVFNYDTARTRKWRPSEHCLVRRVYPEPDRKRAQVTMRSTNR